MCPARVKGPVFLTVGLLADCGGVLDDFDTSAGEELVKGHESVGGVVLSGHGVELEGVGLDHRLGLLLVDGDVASKPFSLGGQAEAGPACLESEHVDGLGSKLCHKVGVLVGLGPCGTAGVHLSNGCRLSEDSDSGPVNFLLFHYRENAVTG